MSAKMMNRSIYSGNILVALYVLNGILLLSIIVNENGLIPWVYSATNSTKSAPTPTSSNASPVAAVITISKNDQGNIIFKPQTITIKQGDEVFIGNNDTSPHSITNGIGSNDPLSGKLFDTGVIKAKGFAEFVASNLNPGKYPYYSSNDPSLKGEIIVVSEK
jgi:plastocyanin